MPAKLPAPDPTIGSQTSRVKPLVSHLFRGDHHLWRSLVDALDQIKAAETPSIEGTLTFGLDDDTVGTNVIGKYGNVITPGAPFICNLSCVTIPTSNDAIFDVLFSHDKGTSWNTIFQPRNPFRFLANSTVNIVEYDDVFGTVTFAVDDLIRVDTIQSGGALGITGVTKWK
jgi:hypothetical protein